MPMQYRIQYRWDDDNNKSGLAGFKKWTSPRRSCRSIMNSSRSPQPVRVVDKMAEKPTNGMTANRKEAGTKQTTTARHSGVTERSKSSSSNHLEKVTLPAGYCVYYAPGRAKGGPWLHCDQHEGKLFRPNSKGLGNVSPDSHTVVEAEYAIIREVMEMYLEKQVVEGREGHRYKVGGHLKQQEELLEELTMTLSEDEGNTKAITEANLTQQNGDHQLPPAEETLRKPTHSSRTVPSTTSTRLSNRCLLPISKSLKTDASPRGPFFMEGQSVLDTVRENYPRPHPPESLSEPTSQDEDSLAEDDVQEDLDGMVGPSVNLFQDQPRYLYREKASEDLSRPGAEPLPNRSFAGRLVKDLQQLDETNDPMPTVNYCEQHHPRETFRNKKFLSSRPMHNFSVPRHSHEPLLIVSERSPVESRTTKEASKKNTTTRISQQKAAIQNYNDDSGTQRPAKRGVFRGAVMGKAIDGTLQNGKSLTFNAGLHPSYNRGSVQTGQERPGEAQGHSSLTRSSSKLVLDVVLPRENRLRKDFPLTNPSMYGQHRQALHEWIAYKSSPPPPSSPNDADGDDDIFNLHEEDGDPEVFPKSSSASVCSAASLQSSTVENVNKAECQPGNAQTLPAMNTQNLSSEDIGHVSSAGFNAPNEAAEFEQATLEYYPHSAEISESQPAATIHGKCAHYAGTPDSSAVPGKQDKAQQTMLSSRDLHCNVLGPETCAACEAIQHRQHFAAQQEILYPNISATPLPMVASRKMKKEPGRRLVTTGRSQRMSNSSSSLSYVGHGQLTNVVTDLELCKRIVERGHRARLPSKFS